MKKIFNKIKKILNTHFHIKNKKILLSSQLKKDLKIDSLDLVELIMLLEETFNIECFDIESEKINNINDIIEYVKKKNKIL